MGMLVETPSLDAFFDDDDDDDDEGIEDDGTGIGLAVATLGSAEV